MVLVVFQDVGRHDRRIGRHLAARETVMAFALEPLVGIVGLVRPRAREDVLACRSEERAGGCRVHRLPARLPEPRLPAFPQAGTYLETDHRVHDRLLDVVVPDSAVVEADLMVETCAGAACG